MRRLTLGAYHKGGQAPCTCVGCNVCVAFACSVCLVCPDVRRRAPGRGGGNSALVECILYLLCRRVGENTVKQYTFHVITVALLCVSAGFDF